MILPSLTWLRHSGDAGTRFFQDRSVVWGQNAHRFYPIKCLEAAHLYTCPDTASVENNLQCAAKNCYIFLRCEYRDMRWESFPKLQQHRPFGVCPMLLGSLTIQEFGEGVFVLKNRRYRQKHGLGLVFDRPQNRPH